MRRENRAASATVYRAPEGKGGEIGSVHERLHQYLCGGEMIPILGDQEVVIVAHLARGQSWEASCAAAGIGGASGKSRSLARTRILWKLGLEDVTQVRVWASPVSDKELERVCGRSAPIPIDSYATEVEVFDYQVKKAAGPTFDGQLRDYKLRLVQKTVQDCGGNKTLAANNLGISRTYLQRLVNGSLLTSPRSHAE